ncbi:cysteine--tRNA ligase [SAR202 cluster bacterium AD-804-J14_MRT_500m]|nr:cysteine--tRNA ligase [SAR202 cluster bacterium AD-804-J14_MRT_500m]
MKLYSTLSRELEDLTPGEDEVKMYVCGITPYAPCHVGHAMSYVIFDVLRRYLEIKGHRVLHIQNFTDIDDKIINRAAEEGITTSELTHLYIQEYTTSMDRLNVKRPSAYPLATESIPKILEVIQGLIDKGYAYPSNGDVYFRVANDEDYGKLSHRTIDNMIAGARVEVLAGKENPMDFALWKAAKPDEPTWESPWGPGRPGWHIECTSICLEHLGETVDIHGGGLDLIFPHHENEIAQSESYTGVSPFAKVWMHNGLLNLDQEKMSKSLGNLIQVSDALDRFTPDALRTFFLSSHYRSPLSYSDDGVTAMERAIDRIRIALRPSDSSLGLSPDPAPYETMFTEAMDSDLNTPRAIGILFELTHAINKAKDEGYQPSKAQESLKQLGHILGLTFEDRSYGEGPSLEPVSDILGWVEGNLDASGHHHLAERAKTHTTDCSSGAMIETLLSIRRELRQLKEFALADDIRTRLGNLNIELEDTENSTIWKQK